MTICPGVRRISWPSIFASPSSGKAVLWLVQSSCLPAAWSPGRDAVEDVRELKGRLPPGSCVRTSFVVNHWTDVLESVRARSWVLKRGQRSVDIAVENFVDYQPAPLPWSGR